MKNQEGVGFIPTVSSPKKQEHPVHQADVPNVVNNYFITVNPQALLFAVLMFVVALVAIRFIRPALSA
jgi:small-conductance mechanosensitive channel